MKDLTEEFEKRFEVVHVSTPEQRHALFRLRYQIFCCQLKVPGFEAERFPNGLETDRYDARSAHCVLRHRPTGAIAGGVRLVLSDPADQETPFPLEASCDRELGQRPDAMGGVPRHRIAEISRLFVAREFGPMGVGAAVSADGAPPEVFPYPILGLLRAVVAMSVRNGVTHLYAMMEPQLNRLLRVLRLNFDPIGPMINCYGQRQPHSGDLWQVLARTQRERPRAWEVVTQRGALRPAEDDGELVLPSPDGPGTFKTAAM